MQQEKYDSGLTYDLLFSNLTIREYSLVVNAIKRQVDYFRNKVFNSDKSPVSNEYTLMHYKSCYKTYTNLYNKIINDYNSIVKCDA